MRALPEAPCLARWGMDAGIGEENTEVAGKETENKEEAMSQTEIIRRVLVDGRPHSAYELARIIARRKYGGARIEHGIRIGARIWDLRKAGLVIQSWRDEENSRKCWYQLNDAEKVIPLKASKATERKVAELRERIRPFLESMGKVCGHSPSKGFGAGQLPFDLTTKESPAKAGL